MSGYLEDLKAYQANKGRWEIVKTRATISAATHFSGFFARIVYAGVPLTGIGATEDAALLDLCRKISEVSAP